MSAQVLELTVREKHGTQQAKKVRRAGDVPGIFYFHGKESIPFTVNGKSLQSTLAKEATLLDVRFSTGDLRKCIVRDIQYHPINHAIIHIDLMGIKLDEKITVSVPVHFVGVSTGVKNDGGILQQVLRELEIECLPADIPEAIELDVTALAIGDALTVSDVVTKNYVILGEPDRTIVTVSAPRAVEEAPVEVEEGAAEPELVGRKPEGEPEEK
ncbi:MAG TPA: 50S ribosomal protein L25 [bacterium]|nr:50S ribosomal protein L25 [bacterium]HQG46488.1 50S ribosomal protein L25 [bacterium]HQI47266.1 50S ribosomal protein L25 [bacterium]HQJ64225.1 50S ribosomal protein L25 [bacterium]